MFSHTDLEIIIPTYNRSSVLNKTLDALLASPVGKCKITILDNNSSDSTKETVEQLMKAHSNLVYIKNRFNLGLAGNICKALTLPTAKYFWIVCDNDTLDFSSWDDVEKELVKDADLIIVNKFFESVAVGKSELEKKALMIAGCMFLPASIIKTSRLNDFIVSYCIKEIPTCFPHMALIYEIVNTNGHIEAIKDNIVIGQPNLDYKKTHDRIDENRFHYSFKNGFEDASFNYIDTLNIIEDKDFKQAMIDVSLDKTGFGYINRKRLASYYKSKKISFADVCKILKVLRFKDRLIFIKCIIREFFRRKKKNA